MSLSKIDELEALLQTPESTRDNTITNTGMTAYQQMVERIVAEITSDGVTPDEIEGVRGKMLKLPDGETKDLFKKMLDKMEGQYEEEEERKKGSVSDDTDIESDFDSNFGPKNFSNSSDQKNIIGALANRIRSCGEYLGNLVEKRFDANGNEVSDRAGGSMIQVSDVAGAAVAIYEIIDCLRAAGVTVEVSSPQKDFDSSQPLAYAIHLPQGFAPRDIYSMTSKDVSEIIELQKQQSIGNQQREPNILMQVVGSEIEQMQQSFKELSANIALNNLSNIRQQFRNLLVENSAVFGEEEKKSSAWRDFVGERSQGKSNFNQGGMQQ